MKNVWSASILLLFVLFSMALSSGQANSAPAASAPTTMSSQSDSEIRGAFGASLVKPLDSKKLKQGDVVVCQTNGVLRSRSGLMIPSGAKVYGHITEATARSKGDSASTLAMVFDKIEVTKGKDIPMKGMLQAVGPSLGSNEPNTGVAGGNQMGGHGGVATMAPPTEGAVAGPNSGRHPLDAPVNRPVLNSQSAGVLGIHNLEMDKDSVLTSSGKEVKLDSGTQMMIRAEIQIPVQ